jgi:hypothetical protein
MLRWDRYGFDKKCTGTHYVEPRFLHPVGSVGHIVNFGASGPRNIDALSFMLRWDLYGFDKKRTETSYSELVILHPVGSAGHVVYSGASGE